MYKTNLSQILKILKEGFLNPPIDCWPHTRWWWPGNAVTKEEITWELEEMYKHGIGGVEIMNFTRVYEKGNIPYLSDQFFEMLKHTIKVAKQLGMEVSITFGPGWNFGGFWLPQEDRSQCMVVSSIELDGPQIFWEELPRYKKTPDIRGEIQIEDIPDIDKLIAVVAGKVINDVIDPTTLIELTQKVIDNSLSWEVPEGRWRLMAFWLKYTGQRNLAADNDEVVNWCVDHFSREAMERYCDFLGGKFYQAFGEEFVETADSFFCDSFEVATFPNSIYWSDALIDEFYKFKGYDLKRYLPALWWEVGEISPKIRYDVNHFLHYIGIEAFFKTFLSWCESHGVKGRIQPYGFTTDILEGAGLTHIPEMEVTPGEKDAVPWFDTRIGPRKYVASGAHLYGRNIVSVEAYTFIHWEPGRATLEELKIASDGFLCSGANKFYNHGYSYSPEREIAPSRVFSAAEYINHQNVWWRYYPLLAKYIARCCYLLRQGDPSPDIAIYSPLANQWTIDVFNTRSWTRNFYWGELGRLLIANGYDFDLINDDILQNRAQVVDGKIKVGSLEYKVLILPNIQSLPLETMEFICDYAEKGGVVIALERLPEYSVGFKDYPFKDKKVKEIVRRMFKEPKNEKDFTPNAFGKGYTYFVKKVIDRKDVLDRYSSVLDPFVNILRRHLVPDFEIDLILEGLRENNGLTFVHRKLNDIDIYFVTNIQDKPSNAPITFRVSKKIPWRWDPYEGKVSRIFHYRERPSGTEIPLRFAPYESTFIIFEPGEDKWWIKESNFYEIEVLSENKITALAEENGSYYVILEGEKETYEYLSAIEDIPAPFTINGRWRLTLEGSNSPRLEKLITHLISWTDDPASKYFSGTGRYEISFNLPRKYLDDNLLLYLDLGKVYNVAEVEINGINIGTRWMRGQRLDITGKVRSGTNDMRIYVTNTLINRLSGLKNPPPVPEELVPYYGRGLTKYSASVRGPIGFEPLPPSGLIGPVRIIPVKKVEILRN